MVSPSYGHLKLRDQNCKTGSIQAHILSATYLNSIKMPNQQFTKALTTWITINIEHMYA